MSEDGIEATFATGQDMSLSVKETLLEELLEQAEITEVFSLHYNMVELGQYKNHIVEVASLHAAMSNAKQLSKSSSVDPASIKVTSHTVITTPMVHHKIEADPPSKAPRWRAPKEHPYIPKN